MEKLSATGKCMDKSEGQCYCRLDAFTRYKRQKHKHNYESVLMATRYIKM